MPRKHLFNFRLYQGKKKNLFQATKQNDQV
jgi:hypothetical protein